MKIETGIAIQRICSLDWRMDWERVWKALDILRGRGDGTDKHASTVDDPLTCRSVLRRNFKELEADADAGKLKRVLGANDVVLGYTRRSVRWLIFGGVAATKRHDRDAWLQHCVWKRQMELDRILNRDFTHPIRKRADWELS